MKRSPAAIAIIARLKKKAGMEDEGEDYGGDDDDEGGEGPDNTSTQDEAELAACEDAIEAFRNRDASALRDAWKAFLDACGVTY